MCFVFQKVWAWLWKKWFRHWITSLSMLSIVWGELWKLPGTCVDSTISKMSLTYNLANAEKIGSSPHNIEGGSSSGAVALACISSWILSRMLLFEGFFHCQTFIIQRPACLHPWQAVSHSSSAKAWNHVTHQFAFIIFLSVSCGLKYKINSKILYNIVYRTIMYYFPQQFNCYDEPNRYCWCVRKFGKVLWEM